LSAFSAYAALSLLKFFQTLFIVFNNFSFSYCLPTYSMCAFRDIRSENNPPAISSWVFQSRIFRTSIEFSACFPISVILACLVARCLGSLTNDSLSFSPRFFLQSYPRPSPVARQESRCYFSLTSTCTIFGCFYREAMSFDPPCPSLPCSGISLLIFPPSLPGVVYLFTFAAHPK